MYHIERISDDLYKDIQDLYKSCFNLHESLNSIRLKYDTEKFGLSNIGFIAKNEKKECAAYYGVFPVILNYEGQDFLIAQSGDTMTAPNHRNQGLFTMLARETYKLCEKEGIKVVFGFPNEKSLPGFKNKLNWEFNGDMRRFVFHVRTIPFCELSSKFRILIPAYEKFVKQRISKYKINFDQINFDAFNYSIVKGHVKKDEFFFEYKLKRENTYVVQVNSIQLLVKPNVHLFIGEVSKIDDSQADILIVSVQKLARRLGCKKIIFTLSQNHWLFNILQAKCTPTRSLPIGFYLINKDINPAEIQFSNADYDTF